MSAWYLLWMFMTAVGIIGLAAATPFLWAWSSEGQERAEMRLYAWRNDRRLRREVELYGAPLRACLYCGSECEFGPNCVNRDLCRSPGAVQARLRRELGRVLDAPPPVLGEAELIRLDEDPVKRLPCPCARCGKQATLLGAFQNKAGQIFCGWACYRAGGAT
jgi:hypothetical protein